jgi:hypothetical protein
MKKNSKKEKVIYEMTSFSGKIKWEDILTALSFKKDYAIMAGIPSTG